MVESRERAKVNLVAVESFARQVLKANTFDLIQYSPIDLLTYVEAFKFIPYVISGSYSIHHYLNCKGQAGMLKLTRPQHVNMFTPSCQSIF